MHTWSFRLRPSVQCRRVGRESEFVVVLAPKSFTGRDLTSRLTWWDHPTVRKRHLSWPEDVDDSVTALIAPIHAAARAGEKLDSHGRVSHMGDGEAA